MTTIEWTDESWNPVTGCTKVSQGCKHCYAERMAHRMWGERKFTDVRCHHERLDMPLKWRKPRRVFVNSMSDLFHPDVPEDFIFSVFGTMCVASHHTFQVLTKRPERMREIVERYMGYKYKWPLPNVWLGVSVENQQAADERIPLLIETPAAVRFLSCEPLLGPVDLQHIQFDNIVEIDALSGHHGVTRPLQGRSEKVDWVICGGESGPDCRPMNVDWARSIRKQCADAGVKFFMKQLGGYPDKRHTLDDLPEDLRVREWPQP